MIIKNISKPIQETLKARERALARSTSTPGDQTTNLPWWQNIDISDMASRSIFVRMISNKKEPVFISGGEVGTEGTPFGFNQNIQKSDALYWDHDNEGIKPKPGIRDISVEYKGGYKAIREASINWSVNSLSDLDRLTPHFLTIGKTVLLEWGWVTKKNSNSITSFYDDWNEEILEEAFTNPMKLIIENKGDYDAMAGVVSNFEYTLNDSGGFDCVTKLTSTGVNLFEGQKADADGADVKIIQKESGEKSDSEITNDGLVNAILNLDRIVFHNYWQMNIKKSGGMDPSLLDTVWRDYYEKDGTNSVLEHFIAPDYTGTYTKAFCASKLGVGLDRESLRTLAMGVPGQQAPMKDPVTGEQIVITDEDMRAAGIGDISDITEDAFFMSTTFYMGDEDSEGGPKSSDVFVRWGWFEDNILSRYTSFSRGEGDEIINSFRSIESSLDDEGKPTGNQVPVLIRNNANYLLPKNPMKFFLPGQNISLRSIDFGADRNVKNESVSYETISDILKLFLQINNKQPFAQGDGRYGSLRNIMVNTKEIKKAFGIDFDKVDNKQNSQIYYSEDVKPPSTVRSGIKKLLSQLNENFFNFWKFEIVTDTHSGNMKIIDIDASAHLDNGDEKKYSTFVKNSSDLDTSALSRKGIYRFPSYRIGSIVQNQNLSFKIPDSMAVTAMYGSNKHKRDGIVIDTSNENSILETIFANDVGDKYNDNKLKGLEKAFTLSGDKHNIGSKSPSKPVRFDGSFEINPVGSKEWWCSWSSSTKETEDDDKKKVEENKQKIPNLSTFDFEAHLILNENTTEEEDRIKKSNIEIDKKIDAIMKDDKSFTTLEETDGHKTLTDEAKEKMLQEEAKREADVLKGKYYTFKKPSDRSGYELSLFTAGEAVIKSLLFGYDKKSSVYQSNYVIPAELTLTVDGIGGLTPGDIIQTDYIQPKYNKTVKDKDGNDKGPFTFFQIFNISQKVNSDGWFTELTTKMRVNNDVLALSAGEIMKNFRIKENPKSIPPPPPLPKEEVGNVSIPGENNLRITANTNREFSDEPAVYVTPDGKAQAFGNFEPNYGLSQGRALGVPLDRSTGLYNNSSLNTYNTLRLQNEFYLQDPGTSPTEERVFEEADISDELETDEELELSILEIENSLWEDLDFDSATLSTDYKKIDFSKHENSPNMSKLIDNVGAVEKKNGTDTEVDKDPMKALGERLELLPTPKTPVISTDRKPVKVVFDTVRFFHIGDDGERKFDLKKDRAPTMDYKVGRKSKNNWNTTWSGFVEAELHASMGFGRQTVKVDIEYGPYWERYDQSSPYYSARKKDGISQDKIEQVAERAARRILNKDVRRKIANGEITKQG